MASPTVTVHLFASVGRSEELHHVADIDFQPVPGEEPAVVLRRLVDAISAEDDDV